MQLHSRFIVSPYLHEVTDPACAESVMEAVRGDGAEARGPAAPAALLFDFLDERFVLVRPEDRQALERLRIEPERITAFATEDPRSFDLLVERRLLVDRDAIFREHRYRTVEIEINRHCNLRCAFCPVATAPKPKGFMSVDDFRRIVERVVEYGAPEVSLHHYSEPTLSPHLVECVRTASRRGLSVRLHTNASAFTEEKIVAIAGCRVRVIVNLPSADRAEYERITGTKVFDRVIRNLALLHQHDIRVELSINSPRETADATVRDINAKFGALFGSSVAWPTDTRAGRVEDAAYGVRLRHAGRLGGCEQALRQINVSHRGQAFLCCQDFDQELVLGSVHHESLRAIAESDRAVQLRKWILGHETPPSGFLCSRCEYAQPISKTAPLRFGSAKKNQRAHHPTPDDVVRSARRLGVEWAIADFER